MAYTGIQERVQVASMVSALKTIDKSLRLKYAEDGAAAWWADSSFGLGNNPSLTTLINNTNLKDYLSITTTPVGSTATWFYDNDNDTYNGCAVNANGVNLIAYNMSDYRNLWEAVDRQIDDGNLSCGRLRYSAGDVGGAIYWGIARNSTTSF